MAQQTYVPIPVDADLAGFWGDDVNSRNALMVGWINAVEARVTVLEAAPIRPKTASFTPSLAEGPGSLYRLANSAAITVTLPTHATAAYPSGVATILTFACAGAGQVTWVAASGAALIAPNGNKSKTQGALVSAIRTADNEWFLAGDVVAQ